MNGHDLVENYCVILVHIINITGVKAGEISVVTLGTACINIVAMTTNTQPYSIISVRYKLAILQEAIINYNEEHIRTLCTRLLPRWSITYTSQIDLTQPALYYTLKPSNYIDSCSHSVYSNLGD